ncbi:MAG: cob(I)yrinic acid a,c-diamide adenosyltransferase [Prevotellaceae bacterium]|jgi:cob(I)alamin adenosyltransferase|nr:cob(I)yrinic acid a,c-diamide adenosyltransferase [Prevotellaceae bacterium]
MKVYTKTGDRGETSLVGGTRTAKNAPRVEAYGTIDELISWIGLLRADVAAKPCDPLLLHIQECLMTCAALLASDGQTHKKLPVITDDDIHALETAIDDMQRRLTPLRAFILPAAPRVAAECHIARTVCRRAERCAVGVAQQSPLDSNVLRYLNRLSDYLFTLAREFAELSKQHTDVRRKEADGHGN